MKPGPAALPVALRIERYSRPEPNTGCTLWSGPVTQAGYPELTVKGKHVLVSRLILGLTRRDDLACHRCDTPNCVNERHLFVGTDKSNARDRDVKGRNGFSSKTHCKHGHSFDKANTKWFGNWRQCRACHRAVQARKQSKRGGKS